MKVNEVTDLITRQVDPEANIIFGTTVDPALDDRVRVTVIATGFDRKKNMLSKPTAPIDMNRKTGASLTVIEGNLDPQQPKKKPAVGQSFSIGYEGKRTRDYSNEDLDIPAFLRRSIE